MPHAQIFTPDARQVVASRGTGETGWGQTWHLPAAAPALTGREFVVAAAQALGVPARHATLSRLMVRLGGLFNADAPESVELLYQNEHPYVFDSTKFNSGCDFTPAPYAEGIRRSLAAKKP